MNFIESFYRLFVLLAWYQCCLGAPPSNYEIPLQSVHVRGVDKTFTGVKLRKLDSRVGPDSCQFDVIFAQVGDATDGQSTPADAEIAQPAENMTNGPFTPAEAEITFLYKKRIVFGVYKVNSSTVYGFNFETEKHLQLFFWSIRYYQPRPESSLYTPMILRYPRNAPKDLRMMAQGCHFHVQEFRQPGFNWKTFNFTKLTNYNDRSRDGVLTFLPKTFSISEPLAVSKFALCHHDLPDEVFVVVFHNLADGAHFYNTLKKEQDFKKQNSCEFPNLKELQINYIATMSSRLREEEGIVFK